MASSTSKLIYMISSSLVCTCIHSRHRLSFPENASSLLDKVMSRNQCHIGVRQYHLMFKGPMQLNYNVLVFTNFYAMAMFQFA